MIGFRVGVGGHVLHGGYGFSSHTHGLALDALVSADVVIANGTIVSASKDENSDLFWALRGAGSSYGIVTSLKFKTHPAPSNNTVFAYGFSWTEAQARNAFAVLQDYANTTMPIEMNMRLFVQSYSTSVTGVYYGSQSDFNAEIAPLLKRLGTPTSTSITSEGWLEMQSNFAYGSLTTPLDYDAVSTISHPTKH